MDVISLGPEQSPQAVSAAVRGEVDLATAADLLLRLQLLAGPVSCEIALDLSQVTFIDCSGLRALVALDRQVRTVGGRVRVTAASVSVARLFELVRPCGEDRELLAPLELSALRRATIPDGAAADSGGVRPRAWRTALAWRGARR